MGYRGGKPRSAKKFVAVICVIFVFAIGLTFLVQGDNGKKSQSEENAEAAYEFLVEYLEICKNDPDKAVDFCHFEDPSEREAFELSPKKLMEYEVLEKEQIADGLYAYKLHLVKEHRDIPERYYFVGKVDGELYLMNNVYNIPVEYRNDMDEQKVSQYANVGRTIVPIEEILQ